MDGECNKNKNKINKNNKNVSGSNKKRIFTSCGGNSFVVVYK